ncbi:hypothetical protein COLINT_02787 [Collinsella intestinalis DSM 13280]|uniref:Uncharacterized protein n=1 Tax=Collinsella intestinalis DSM 13280 TaxID=521003 RepID=C4F9Q3_9ACTN|nr:hypothetical protein COLINT_02787 [Collinsella intestinalis DSM 13280]
MCASEPHDRAHRAVHFACGPSHRPYRAARILLAPFEVGRVMNGRLA